MSSKKIIVPNSLYKTETGKNISHASYDKAMRLWNIDFREEYVVTDYGKSHVIVSGQVNGQPLVLLPGLFADATMWYANVSELSNNYRVYTLDMLNYGGKGEPDGKVIKDIKDYNIWVDQIFKHFNINKASVAGLSYGSWLALALAREKPSIISSLMLLDPSETFMPMNGGIVWKGFKAFMFFPNREKYRKFFDWLGGGYSDEKMNVWFEHMLNVIEFGSTKMTDVPMHRIYKPEELTMINFPVLVMAGGKPILYKDPQGFKSSVLKAIPHAKVVIVEGAGHGLNMERPEEVNKEMIEFLNSNTK
jgi:pimeloyl-ACP methyl ester carboxylesterase